MELKQWRGHYLTVTTEQRGVRTFERVHVRHGVSIVLITSEGKLRFVRERDWSQGGIRTKLVSGYVRDEEDPLACAQRELDEELGLTAQEWELLLRSTSEEGAIEKVQSFFLARSLSQGAAHPDEDEQIEGYVDLALDEVRDMAVEGKFGTTATAYALLRFTSR